MDSKRPPSSVECWVFRLVLLGVVSLVPILILTAMVAPAKANVSPSPGTPRTSRSATTALPLPRVRIVTIDPDREMAYVVNNDAGEQDLSDWRLVSRGGKMLSYRFPPGFRLAPGAIVRVNSLSGIDSSGDLWWNLNPGEEVWGERGDTASLLDADGHLVSTFSYARW